MTKTNENQANEGIINRVNVYSIYDTVLKQYYPPIALKESNLKDYFTLLINDVQSPYYNHESDYVLFNLGEFDIKEGIVINYNEITKICHLDSFIDNKRRNLQTLLQTINYLPTGYFKMPVEMKQQIQENIEKATQKYVEDYVIPDLDVNKVKFDDMQSKIDDLTLRLQAVSPASPGNVPDDGCGIVVSSPD